MSNYNIDKNDEKIIVDWINKFKKEKDKKKPVDIARWLVNDQDVKSKDRLDALVKAIYFEI